MFRRLGKWFLILYVLQAIMGIVVGVGFVVLYSDRVDDFILQTCAEMETFQNE